MVDCEYTHNLICPYCGYEFEESWEIEDGEGQDEDCPACDKKFKFNTVIERTFTSYQMPCMNGSEHDWSKWQSCLPTTERRYCLSCGEAEFKKKEEIK